MFSATKGGSPSGYQISRSVRLRSSASAYLNRTFGTPTNNRIWTWSAWVKRGTLPASSVGLFGAGTSGGNYCFFGFLSTHVLNFQNNTSSGNQINATTPAVFRDPSAWYHVVLAVDTTQATNSNGVRLWVNGVQQTLTFSTYTQNTNTLINAASGVHVLGDYINGGGLYFDGYLTEVNFIDGQALDPSYFGETNATTGVWQPKKYAGSYGTNGFYLNFSDNSSNTATTIGKDYSGNGNNWTPNNISVTAGVTYDSMLDVPTLWADGGNGRGNYAVLNSLNNPAVATFADGNLRVTNASGDYRGALSTIAIPSSGKWYWEVQMTSNPSGSSIANIGIAPLGIPLSGNQNGYANSAAWYMNASTFWIGGGTSIGASSTSDVFQIAYDAATGKVWLGRNNVWYWGNTTTNNTTGDPAGGTNQSFTLTPTEFYAWSFAYANGFITNFGQRPFAYTPPTGFKALNTLNLPEPTILKGGNNMNAVLWTGNGASSRSFTGWGFAPDLIWIKGRSIAADNALIDTARGTGAKVLESNMTDAENSYGLSVTSFDSDGFTGATGSINFSYANSNAATYVGWGWKEGATQGFDIVTFTNTASSASFNHSLGVTPAMIILKGRGPTAANWSVFHKSLANMTSAFLGLNTTNAVGTLGTAVPAPTSTTFGSSAAAIPASESSVAYLFAEVAGFSKFGSYTGNGSADGPFVFCGFRPRFVMWKNASVAEAWLIEDTARSTYNELALELYPNTSGAETAGSSRSPTQQFDFLSNGFKVRGANNQTNGSGNTIIFAAFAESPFKNSLAR